MQWAHFRFNIILHTDPKDPAVLKNTTESEIGAGREIRYGGSKTVRRVLGNSRLPKEKGQENGTDSTALRRSDYSASKYIADSSAIVLLARPCIPKESFKAIFKK